MTDVTVLWSKYVRSWPQRADEKPLRLSDRVYVAELGKALDRDYNGDAHMAAYVTHNDHRLNVAAIDEGAEIEITTAIYDIDCLETHGKPEPAPESWRREQRELIVKLADVHPGLFYYETRGGVRFVYRLDEPRILRTQEDARIWSQDYCISVAYFERRFGIVADPSCCDWQRLYRLPRVTRDPDVGIENWPSWGNPYEIGTLEIHPTPADIVKATAKTTAFHTPKHDSAPGTYVGSGLLFHLLNNRGDIRGNEKKSKGGGRFWPCLCPNRAQHRTNSDGTDRTAVFEPKNGYEIGTIVCKRGSCQHMTNRDWLRYFSDAELEAGRRSAGIERKRRAA